MNALNWFEIPANDLQRAIGFYQSVLGLTFTPDTCFDDVEIAVFPHSETGVGGALVKAAHLQPNAQGTIAYLGTSELDAVLARVPTAGGAVLKPKTFLHEDIGHIAVIRDSEGNTVGLHMPMQ